MKYYIGIDIGLTGGMSIIDSDDNLIECVCIPTIDVLVGHKNRKNYDIYAVYKKILDWVNDYHQVVLAGFERLRAIPHQSSQTAFSMGGGAMLFKTIFTILGVRYIEIEPRHWQKYVFKKLGIQYNTKTTKKASIQAAKRLFPKESFLPTDRSRVVSDGLTDSACIAYYLVYNN